MQALTGSYTEPLAAQPPQHDRAGAAVALGAAFLGAGRGVRSAADSRATSASARMPASFDHLAVDAGSGLSRAHQLPR